MYTPLHNSWLSTPQIATRRLQLAVENERLTWELSQLQGLVDCEQLACLRTDTDTLRRQMLQMHAESQVVTC